MISSCADHFLPTVTSNEGTTHHSRPLAATLRSSKRVRGSLRKTRPLCPSINMTALLFTALWQPCSFGTAQWASPRSLKQLSMTVSRRAAPLQANWMGGYDKVGWHSASGAVQNAPQVLTRQDLLCDWGGQCIRTSGYHVHYGPLN